MPDISRLANFINTKFSAELECKGHSFYFVGKETNREFEKQENVGAK